MGEIESAVNGCKSVKTSVVLAKTDADHNKHPIAYIVSKVASYFEKAYEFKTQTKEKSIVYTGENIAQLVEGVRDHISQFLPEYMVPNFFMVLDKIPLTLNGKIDRERLISLDIGKRLSVKKYVAPRNEMEEKLCKIWEEVLRIDKVGINDNFFKIGGDSLQAIKVVNLVKVSFFPDIKVADIFSKNTISQISKVVTNSLNKFKYKDYLIEKTDKKHLFDRFELTNVQQAY